MYQHRLNKLKLLLKSSLVGLIHEKTMNTPSISYDNGESTTLMSTDADSLEDIAEMFHETWAQLLEVAIGMVLLAGEVGRIWPLPLVFIFRKRRQYLTPCWRLTTKSMLSCESVCCEAPSISTKGVE